MNQTKPSNSNQPQPNPKFKVNLLELGLEFGLIILIPLLGLISLGLLVDKKLQTTPLFILIGLFIALAISSYSLYKKIQEIFKELHLNKKK